ncbi:MAG: J domain-containing protein, partial [Candidatus Poribacteria bacterium]|nr:J domain-containing protein [Candidatus Poribacteria bacterium]
MNASKDYYRILEVHHEASREMIDRAKRVLLQRYHPDHNIARTDWAAAQTREVLEAYDVISDDAARKQYDAARQGGDSQRRQSTGQRQASSPSGGRARAGSASRTAASSTKGKAGASRGQAQRRTARPKPPPRATVHPSSTPGIRIA